MNDSSSQVAVIAADTQAADAAAERIVRHFQSRGFSDIGEVMIIHIHLKQGDLEEVEEAFDAAQEEDKAPPVDEYFEIQLAGFFSEFRSFDQARDAFESDLTVGLRGDIPTVFFDPAPVVIEDPLGSGTKYDIIMKIRDNVEGYAVAALVNDPGASLFDYIGEHRGDWKKIMEEFERASSSVGDAFYLR